MAAIFKRAADKVNPVHKYQIVELDVKPDPGPAKPDMVSAPPHYTRLSPQPMEVIRDWALNFPRGSAVKYIARAPFKGNEIEDLNKAINFLKWEVVCLEVAAKAKAEAEKLK
jgi:hypothetical protein